MGLMNVVKCDFVSLFLVLNFIFVNFKGDFIFVGMFVEWDSIYKENLIMLVLDEVVVLVCFICNMVECNGMVNIEFVVMVL